MTVSPYLTLALSAAQTNALAGNDLFPAGDHAFALRGHRDDPRNFFAPQHPGPDLLAERARWIGTAPERHLLAPDQPLPALHEFHQRLLAWNVLSPSPTSPSPPPAAEPASLLAALGCQLEPDFLLLQPSNPNRTAEPSFRLAAACVCFPSSWSLPDKRGGTLDDIHAVVPGLNSALGRSINRFLARLPADQAWCRVNWGLSASPERNQDPSRGLPRLAAGHDPRNIWFRIEHQALITLPESHAIAFGIRVDSIPLTALRPIAAARAGLRHALAVMPDDLADYKGLRPIRRDLIAWLDEPISPLAHAP